MVDARYRQIANDLRQQIERGDLAPGTRLRTELKLGKQYAVSRNTIRNATSLLMTWGLVEARPDQGTFVIEPIVPFATTLAGDPSTAVANGTAYVGKTAAPAGEADLAYREVIAGQLKPAGARLQVKVQVPPVWLARKLRIKKNELVVIRRQERFIDGTPWSLQTSFYPMSLVERGASRLIQAQDIPSGTVAYLGRTLSIKQVGYRDRIAVRAANAEEALFFELSDGLSTEMFVLIRTGCAEDATAPGTVIPFRVTVTMFLANQDLFSGSPGPLVVDLARAPAEFVVPA